MGHGEAELLSSIFSFPDGIVVQGVQVTTELIVVEVACNHLVGTCPLCQQSSERIHSCYARTIADVPCGGRRVVLSLTVRKFVCATPTCVRKIFTEQHSAFIQIYARKTNRLRQTLEAIGFATCGEVGARLTEKMGSVVSASTLLHYMRTVACPPPEAVRILGVDDWAWRKGQSYGTILVDLERRCPIELLPDRKAETLEAWLRLHPEIQVVSRDRAGAYAEAARKGAPQAQEVADRFHLLKNLRDALKDFMRRKQAHLPEVEQDTTDAVPSKARGCLKKAAPLPAPTDPPAPPEPEEPHFRKKSAAPKVQETRETRLSLAEERKQASRDARSARYEAVRELHQHGLSEREIARRLGLSRQTVSKLIHAESVPEYSKRSPSGSILDPYKPYLRDRWKQGCHNGTQLCYEIKQQGYTGSDATAQNFVTQLRREHQAQATAQATLPASPSASPGFSISSVSPITLPLCRLSPTQASWLCISQPQKLTKRQGEVVKQIQAAFGEFDTAYQLVQTFVLMLADHQDQKLDLWLSRAEQSGIAELVSFAHGIRRDYQAVRSAFTSPWSNGQVEGQVGRLKLQKRQMYGRANFDLLRVRVLHSA